MLDAFLSANPKDQVTTKRSREPSSSLLMGYDFIIKEFNPLVISDDDHGEEQFSRVRGCLSMPSCPDHLSWMQS